MGFIEKIKSLFAGKEVEQEKVDKIIQIANEEKPIEQKEEQESDEETAEQKEEQKENAENPEQQEGIYTTRAFDISSLDINSLALSRIEREAETIIAYSKLLLKDIMHYKDNKSESKLDAIEKKYKMIFIHSMELKNLLESLNDVFYNYIIQNIEESNPQKAELAQSQEKITGISELLAGMGLYDELFNPEKSPDYKKNLDIEIQKGEFAKQLDELAKSLAENINNPRKRISSEIARFMENLRGQ